MSAKITTGTFTRNTEPHQKWLSNHPPTIGPIAIPRPDTPAHIPIARPRSSAGKTLVRIDSVDGMISAPPTPIRARLAISALDVWEKADSVDPTPKITRPSASAFRRPYRSDRLPVVSSSPAKTKTYASTIHWSWLLVAPRSRDSVGNATLRIVLSSP